MSVRAKLNLERAEEIVRGLLGDEWDIQVIHCDGLTEVYAVSARMSLTRPFACGIYARVVYLLWVDDEGL